MANLLGRKWHLVILHQLLTEGAMGFGELKGEIDHISSKVLSDSLDRLETEHELVERRIVSEAALRKAYREGWLVVTPVVYADGHFEAAADVDRFLDDFRLQLVEPSRDALFQAGEQFRQYTSRRPDRFQCPACGNEQSVVCAECGADLSTRGHVAADFLIGGHAAVDVDALVSFDRGFYQTYFPSVRVRPDA